MRRVDRLPEGLATLKERVNRSWVRRPRFGQCRVPGAVSYSRTRVRGKEERKREGKGRS